MNKYGINLVGGGTSRTAKRWCLNESGNYRPSVSIYSKSNWQKRFWLVFGLQQLLQSKTEKQHSPCYWQLNQLWSDSRTVQCHYNIAGRIPTKRADVLLSRCYGRNCNNLWQTGHRWDSVSVHQHSNVLLDLFIQLSTLALSERGCVA